GIGVVQEETVEPPGRRPARGAQGDSVVREVTGIQRHHGGIRAVNGRPEVVEEDVGWRRVRIDRAALHDGTIRHPRNRKRPGPQTTAPWNTQVNPRGAYGGIEG